MSEKQTVLVHGDGIHDDSDAIEAILTGRVLGILPDGRPWNSGESTFRITRTIHVDNAASFPDFGQSKVLFEVTND